jgi:hypothetical protein
LPKKALHDTITQGEISMTSLSMQGASPSLISYGPGQSSLEDLVDYVFYGVRQDKNTSKVTIDKISGDEPIRLPDQYVARSNDYKNWLWSNNTLRFSFTNDGRILMEVL